MRRHYIAPAVTAAVVLTATREVRGRSRAYRGGARLIMVVIALPAPKPGRAQRLPAHHEAAFRSAIAAIRCSLSPGMG